MNWRTAMRQACATPNAGRMSTSFDAGIDVFTTVNVQHLESLNDVVSGITGVQVRETVPDPFFDAADDVVLVDLPPDDLRQRLNEGKVYIGGQAGSGLLKTFSAKET